MKWFHIRRSRHYFDGGSAALGTDFFRYAMQAKGLGAWVDLDLYFIRPIDFQDEYVFGWEHRSVDKRRRFAASRRIPTWFANSATFRTSTGGRRSTGRERRSIFYWRRLTEGDLRPENYRWGTFGPMFLTYLARKYRRRETGKETIRLLSGHASAGWKLLLRPAGTRRSRADEGNEDGPPLAFRIEPENRRCAAAWVLP